MSLKFLSRTRILIRIMKETTKNIYSVFFDDREVRAFWGEFAQNSNGGFRYWISSPVFYRQHDYAKPELWKYLK